MSSSARPQGYYSRHRSSQPTLNPWTIRLPMLATAGLVLFFFLMVTALAGYQFMYQDKIYPGVSTVYGVNLAGMTRDEARITLQERLSYPANARFVFRNENQQWEYTAAQLGVNFDIEAIIEDAYQVGRNEGIAGNLINQWDAWRNGYPLIPKITYNQGTAEGVIAQIGRDYIDQPVRDATLTISNLRAVTTPSQVGYTVDVPATLARLQAEIARLSEYSVIELVIRQQNPEIWDAEAAAALVNTALDPRGVTFFIAPEQGADAGPWTAEPASIENMLRIERESNGDGTSRYVVRIESSQVQDFLTRIAPDLIRDPVNARFIFNDETRLLEVIQPSQNGRELNVETTLPKFETAVFSSTDRTVALVFNEVLPPVADTMSGQELGITELVVAKRTYFPGSTAARRANVRVAASKFHGLVIPPGAEFSFNQWLGDVSLDEGFEQALIIVNGQTITGVGGGVCQVSSTAFQAAFYGGYPIIERYPHAYRVGYYEQGEGPGMDATVFSPIVDFRFLNDTPYHLLIETYVDLGRSTVEFRFYSTSVGRRVVKEGPYIRNVRPAPAPIYRASGDVAPGGAVQVDYAVSGSDVYVYRTVYDADGNKVIDREEFFSNYVPWAAQFLVAPGDRRING